MTMPTRARSSICRKYAACCKRAAAEREARKLDPDLKTPEAREKMSLARAKQKEAEVLAGKEFMSQPLQQKAYQPCGDLWLEFPAANAVSGYRRVLNLNNAIATTVYRVGDVTYKREVFALAPGSHGRSEYDRG